MPQDVLGGGPVEPHDAGGVDAAGGWEPLQHHGEEIDEDDRQQVERDRGEDHHQRHESLDPPPGRRPGEPRSEQRAGGEGDERRHCQEAHRPGQRIADHGRDLLGKIGEGHAEIEPEQVEPVVGILLEQRRIEPVLGAIGGRDGLDIDILRAAGRLQPGQSRLHRVTGEQARNDEIDAHRDEDDQQQLAEAGEEVADEFAAHWGTVPLVDARTRQIFDVIPAKAGTQLSAGAGGELGPCFRRDDTGGCCTTESP